MTTIETHKLDKTILSPTSADLESFEGVVTLEDLKLLNRPDDELLIRGIGADVLLTLDHDHTEAGSNTLVYTGFLQAYQSKVKLIVKI